MKYTKLILFTLIAVVITDAFRLIASVGAMNVDNATLFATIINYISIAILFYFANKEGFGNNEIPKSIKYLFLFWLFWNLVSLVRGSFFAVDYWDWKAILLNSMAFSLIPLAFFLGKNISSAGTIFRFVLKYLFPLGFLIIPLSLITSHELYSRLMIPVGLFIVFIPFLKFRWKFLVILVAVTSIFVAIEFRTNIIKIAFSVVLLLVYYFRNFIRKNWLLLAQFCLFAVPLVLFNLAVTNQYNIFKEILGDEGYMIDNEGQLEQNFMADTRTGLYVDVLSSLSQSENWLLGEGAGGKYQTERFDYLGDGRGRYGSEVGILNILLYHGIIGVVIYFLLLFSVSFIAIKRSNNILAKMLGLFIAFRWTYAFIEEFTQYDLNFYFFWIVMGLVSSASFREMNDDEIRNYLELR